MTALSQPSPALRLDPATAVGPVALIVHDRKALTAWYGAVLGLVVLAEDDRATVLGVSDGTPLVTLIGDAAARLAPRRSSGLYHLAVLLPTRADLGRWLRHVGSIGVRLEGAADHLVSEATYLSDPEGNGIEVYRDRPKSEWTMRGTRVVMDNARLDIGGILAEADAEGRIFDGAPAGTIMGHVHLKVADLAATEAFYVDLLGFDVMETFPSAMFLSAGGYHHHVGTNIWESAGTKRIPGTTGLAAATVTLPAGARANLTGRLAAAGIALRETAAGVEVTDPSGNRIVLLDQPVGAEAALRLQA